MSYVSDFIHLVDNIFTQKSTDTSKAHTPNKQINELWRITEVVFTSMVGWSYNVLMYSQLIFIPTWTNNQCQPIRAEYTLDTDY